MDPWINAMTTQKRRKTCDRLHREHAAGYVNTRTHPQHQIRQGQEQQFEGHEDYFYRVALETGWKYYFLAATTSSSSSSWWRPSDIWWTAWNWDSSSWSEQYIFFCSRCEHFRLQEHFVARILLMRTVCQVVLSGSHPSLTFLAPALLPILRHDLPQRSRLSILARSIPAAIHNKRASAFWLMYALPQVMTLERFFSVVNFNMVET